MRVLSRWRFWVSVNPFYWLGLLLVTCTLSILAAHFHWLPWQKFILHEKAELQAASSNKFVYHDFDHDGLSELFRLKLPGEGDYEPAVVVHAYNGGLIDQWNFAEPILLDRIFFGDYDGDNADEVFVLTRARDSLFLYAFSPSQPGEFVLYRQFLLRAPRPNPHPAGQWDIQHTGAVLADRDGDGFKEIYLCLQAGFSRYPRGIYCFDIHRQKMVASSASGEAYFADLLAADLDGDGAPEILPLHASSPGNSDASRTAFSDHDAWVMVFDRNLKFLFPPVRFPHMGSSLHIAPVWQHGEAVLLVVHNYTGYLNISPSLRVIDLTGKQLVRRSLDEGHYWQIYTDNSQTRALLISPGGELSLISPDLTVVKTLPFAAPFLKVDLRGDLNGDRLPELIGPSREGYIQIIDGALQGTIRSRNLLKNLATRTLSVKQEGDGRAQLMVWAPGEFYSMVYARNPFYPFRWPLLIALMALLFYLSRVPVDGLLRVLRLRLLARKMFDTGWQQGILFDHLGRVCQVSPGVEKELALGKRIEAGDDVETVFAGRTDLLGFVLAGWQHPQPAEMQLGEKPLRLQRLPLGLTRMLKLGVLLSLKSEQAEGDIGSFYREWSRTVQKLAHDIKTPMSAIQLNLQTLKWKLEAQAPDLMPILQEDFSLISEELHRVRELTKNFLKFTNLEAPRFEPIHLPGLLSEALQQFQGFLNEHLRVDLELGCDQEWIAGDPEQLKMLFHILIENAIDAMEGRGRILITSDCSEDLELPGRQFVEIEVADTGPGIPPEVLPRVFEPYFTTKADGLGLGLALARKIVQDHGGQISIYTRKGFSTVVRVRLPVKQNIAREDVANLGR
ncbi:MAG: hypothetical protein D6715_13440 [Calditrichaeota bacterium]|nr:MAG: hypothetical protein D6715_13440 [Calditrichota bacterium]